MSTRTRRRRAAVMLALAVACGGLAASEVGGRVREAERRFGEPVPVVVAARDIAPDTELSRDDLTLRQMPERFAPRDAASAPGQAVGLRTVGPIAVGSPLTAGVLGVGAGAGGAPGPLRRGERALDVAVKAGAALAERVAVGVRVDVLVSTEPGEAPGRTFVALEDVEVLALGADGGGSGDLPLGAAAEGDDVVTAVAVATLRVTPRQAVYLTAAQSYARELRLLPRPAGDRRRLGRATVTADGL